MYVAPAARPVTITAPAASPLVPEFADLVAPAPPPQMKQAATPES
jgi:hypothetical protein